MTDSTTAPRIDADVLAMLRRRRDVIAAQLDGRRHCLVSHGWVVGWADTGICVEATPDADGVVHSVRAVGIENATRLTRGDAENLTRNGNITNGHGTPAAPLSELDVLERELTRATETLAFFSANV
jgi:hypothetical protein